PSPPARRPVPGAGTVGGRGFPPPDPSVVRSEEEVSTCLITNPPRVNPRRDVGRLLRVEQRGSGPRIRLGYVGRGGESRLQCRFARRIVDLTDEIPFFLRREIKNLRRAKVTVADLEHVALGLVRVYP